MTHRLKAKEGCKGCGNCNCKAPLSELILKKATEKDIPGLVKGLGKNPDSMERMRAAMLLGSIGDRMGVDALADALKTDKEWAVRMYSAEALGKIGGVRAQNALVEALRDRDPKVRMQATDSLAKIEAYAAIAEIEKLSADPVGYVARNAARTAAQMKIDVMDPYKAAQRAWRHGGHGTMHSQLSSGI